MTRTILTWALVLAVGVSALERLQAKYLTHAVSRELYISLIGVAFAAGGVLVGSRLTRRHAPAAFATNTAAPVRNPEFLPARSRPA